VEDCDFRGLEGIPPGSRKLVSIVSNLNNPGSSIQQQVITRRLDFYRRQRAIEVSADALIFADGSTAGQNSSKWIDMATAQIEAEKAVFAAVVARTQGQTLSGILSPMIDRALRETSAKEANPGEIYSRARHAQGFSAMYVALQGYLALQLLERSRAVGEPEVTRLVQKSFAGGRYPTFRRDNQ